MKLSKNEVAKKVHECAVIYKENLLGKNVLFLSLNENKISDYFECLFLARNFQHLTGVSSAITGANFFHAALNSRLSENNLWLEKDGTTELKLSILKKLMNIHLTARMIGDYDNSKTYLVTDKLAGTVTGAMGFIEDNGYYVPNTVLKEDLRNLSFAPRQRVLATFIKSQNDKFYTELSYAITDNTILTDDILGTLYEKVDFTNLNLKSAQF